MGEYEQLGLFDDVLEEYTLTKPVRLISFFSGIEAQFKALSYLGKKLNKQVESYKTCEWAYNSIIACNSIHNRDFTDYSEGKAKEEMIEHIRGISVDYNKPLTDEQLNKKPLSWIKSAYNNCIANHNLINIMDVKGEDLEIVDTDNYEYILTYSFPCLTADTLVLTDNGYKKIIDIKVGDKVLTHTGIFKKVLNWWHTGNHKTLKLKAAPFDEIILTENHKVYTLNGWKEARHLIKGDMLCLPINTIEEIPNYNGVDFIWKDGRKPRHSQKIDMTNPNFWWIVGRYMGDGWLRNQGGIIICCAKDKLNEITSKLNGMFNYSVVKERTTYKVHIPIKELSLYLEQYGIGAENKHLGKDILNLPIDLLKSFLEGYFSADGCQYKNIIQCNSVSKALIYDIAQCYIKVYKRPYSIYKITPPPTKIIENRIVNQKCWYQFRVRESDKLKSWYEKENERIWFPLHSIEENGNEEVYDIEIEEDHSFVANSTVVHNCQDLSLAGKRAGMDMSQKEGGTRSGLLWEFERIIGELAPEQRSATILVMENVPQIHSDKDMPNFIKWQERLEELGYVSFWKDLNAKDYGIPQNRDRTFMVSVYGKQYHYKFPLPFKRELTLKDMLEDKVDEKYYLSKKMIDYLTGVNQKESKFDRGSRFASSLKTTNEENIAGCITTAAGQRPTDNFITDDIKVVGNYMPSGHNAGRVVDTNGIAPTVMENHGTVTAVAEYQGTYDYAQSDTLRPTEKDRFHENAEVSGTVLASGNQNGIVIRNNTEQGYLIAEEGDGINIGSRMHHQRGNVQPGMAQTLKTSMEVGVLDIPKQVGYIEKGTGQHQSNTVYSADGLSPTLTASDKKEPIKFLMEESLFTETEASLFTEDGNIRRYLGSDQIDEFKEGQMATTTFPNGYGHGTRTHNESITLNTIDRPVVKNNLRIRKLTPCEATRLMGFTDLDYEHIKETGLGDGAVYHCMGDSLVCTVMLGILSKLYGLSNKETEKIIREYIANIKKH